MAFKTQNIPFLTDDTTGRLGYKNSVTGLDMALVDPASANITGGAINGTTIGATTPTTVAATSLNLAAGTVGAPPLNFVGATNSGFYSPTANTFAFVIAGTEVGRVNNTGNFLLGAAAEVGSGKLQVTGDISAVALGFGYRVREGANGKQGSAVLVAGVVTINTTNVTANSRILLTSQVDGGAPGFLRVSSRVVGTSFTVTSSMATDTSTIAYEIFEPA